MTIQKKGTLSLNKAAQVALGEPDAVELLFDASERIVGMRGADLSLAHAYPLRAQKPGFGPYVVAGTAFTKYYGIDTTTARRWIAYMDEGVLCLDLKEEGTIATSNRNGHGSSDEEPTAAASEEESRG
ncbi:MAG: hypothetical protein GEV09_16530 [Pseudonocardiaceae bacterium]|nr:hypothetical protein [Pseudonocardiaceae bacterium]